MVACTPRGAFGFTVRRGFFRTDMDMDKIIVIWIGPNEGRCSWAVDSEAGKLFVFRLSMLSFSPTRS